MEQRTLGRTGLQVSVLGYGAGAVGGLFTKGEAADQERAAARALEYGINYFDTAPQYGDGASEATIGRHIHALDPQPYVSTKVRIERDQMNDISGAIERSLEQSLKRLNLEQVTLFQLHNQLGEAVGDRPQLTAQEVLAAGGVADTFDRLKEQGLFRASGITAAGETSAILDVIDSGRFDCAQVYYNAVGRHRVQRLRALNAPAMIIAHEASLKRIESELRPISFLSEYAYLLDNLAEAWLITVDFDWEATSPLGNGQREEGSPNA